MASDRETCPTLLAAFEDRRIDGRVGAAGTTDRMPRRETPSLTPSREVTHPRRRSSTDGTAGNPNTNERIRPLANATNPNLKTARAPNPRGFESLSLRQIH